MTEINGRHEAVVTDPTEILGTDPDTVTEVPADVPATPVVPPAIPPVPAVTDPAADAPGTPPKLSPQTRTAVYIASLALNVIAIMVLGFLVVLGVVSFEKASALGSVVFAALGLVSSGLGTGYRPTRPGTQTA